MLDHLAAFFSLATRTPLSSTPEPGLLSEYQAIFKIILGIAHPLRSFIDSTVYLWHSDSTTTVHVASTDRASLMPDYPQILPPTPSLTPDYTFFPPDTLVNDMSRCTYTIPPPAVLGLKPPSHNSVVSHSCVHVTAFISYPIIQLLPGDP